MPRLSASKHQKSQSSCYAEHMHVVCRCLMTFFTGRVSIIINFDEPNFGQPNVASNFIPYIFKTGLVSMHLRGIIEKQHMSREKVKFS